MGVGVSVAPVLASQSVAVEASGRHHITLGVPAVCKAASPRYSTPICHVPGARGSRQAPLTTLPPRVLPARCVHVHCARPGALLMFLQPLAVLRPVTATPLPKQKADTQRSHYASRERLWLWLGDCALLSRVSERSGQRTGSDTSPEKHMWPVST